MLWESKGKETMSLLAQFNFWDVTSCQSPICYGRFAGFFFSDMLVETGFSRNQELITLLQGIMSHNNFNF